VLLRLAYLAMTNTFTLVRLLPIGGRDKDIEILALRHQLLVLQRQVGRPAFTDTDRVVLAGLLHRVPREKLRQLLLLVRPDTVLRWHRDLIKGRHGATCAPKRRGRPPTVRSIRTLVLRLARENSSWGYRRIHGELAALGVKVAASTVWEILREHGVAPAPARQSTTWADFLRSQADGLLACDFFETRTLTGARLYVFAVIEHTTRRIRILGAAAHPTAGWVVQLGRNLVMDLEDAGGRARFLIRDRDSKFTHAFDAVLADAGLEVVKSGVRMPRMNSIMERWIQTCRRELLDRTLHMGPAPSAPRPARVRVVLQLASAAPGPGSSRSAAPAARTDYRARADPSPGGPSTRSTRRNPSRIPTCRLSGADD